jgi:dienelactone hydrolase
MQDLGKLKSIQQWQAIRAEVEEAVHRVLGEMPKDRIELQVKTLDELSFPGFTRTRISYFVDDWERVSAWVFVPEGRDEAPGILCCHQGVPQGKDEPAGLDGSPLLAFAHHYAELGYVTLAPDCITAGERVSHGLKPYDTKSFYKDNPKMSAIGKMLVDHSYALDALAEMRRVDAARIGVIGHSMGASNALFLAASDDRVQACVASCGFTRFSEDKEPERWVGDNGFVHLPLLREAVKKREFPFDWEHLLAMCAPSPTLIITALNDEALSNPRSCEKAVKLARQVYTLLGPSEALGHFTHSGGHDISQEALRRADDWFERWL